MRPELPPRVLAILLAALVALTPFSIDTYLPAIPAMATWFGTSIGMVEMTIGSFFLGYALGQIVGGPLSDHYGRRRVGGPGVVIFLVATIAIIFAPNIESAIFGRFVQAFGGGFVTVIAPSVVRDRYTGKEAARMYALIGVVMMLAPLVAPAVGALLLKIADWRMIFAFLATYALISLAIIFLALPERKKALTERLNMAKVWASYGKVLSHRRAVGYMVTQSFSSAVMFLFLTGSAFAYITYLGVSTDMFPVLFGANVVTMMFFNRLNPFLLNIFSPHQLIGAGITIQLVANASLLAGQFIDPLNLYMVVPMIMLSVGAAGLTSPNTFACYLEDFEENSGAATALLGTAQFVLAGILSAVLGVLHSDNILPMTSMMLMASIISVLSYWTLTRRS
ncbi:MAG: Bcr/CflA family drug resistance efflux transporter [Alphaproteobacteria bacterium]|nr:MAG: Bcr/CflA family drug resistance efflux transporter [Alphaproteobacteria bacterium]